MFNTAQTFLKINTDTKGSEIAFTDFEIKIPMDLTQCKYTTQICV